MRAGWNHEGFRASHLRQVVSEPGTCLCISGERRKEEHSDTHDLRQVVSEWEFEVLFVWVIEGSRFHNAAKERATVA